nr:hypothetical protein [Tanacetum cinerariifolium]
MYALEKTNRRNAKSRKVVAPDKGAHTKRRKGTAQDGEERRSLCERQSVGHPNGVRKLQAISSTVRGMLKLQVEGGVITLKSNRLIPLKCALVSGLREIPQDREPIVEERIQVAINPEYPEQTIMIGSTLTEEGRNKLQKKRGQAADRNQAIQEEVGKLVEADFKDLNKACPKDGYPLPEIDWKVESLCEFSFKCFLDAYKGYHQIQMAKENEEKTAFITSQGIFCYTKIPFGLRNAEATYQRLVDKEFHKQISRNLKVYMDDLVIKSCTEDEIVDAVLNLPSPKCLKDVQRLNEKLARLNRFLAKSVEKSLPFFKTLKKCTKKSDLHWIAKAEEAFKQIKQLIAELPMLTARKKETYCLLGSSKREERVSAVIMTEKKAKQIPIYFISRALRGPELNYTPMEKLILADFIVEGPEEDSSDTLMEVEEKLPELWILFTDGSSCTDGSGAGLILTNPKEVEFTYALRFSMHAGTRSVVAKALHTDYHWPTMHKDARTLIRACQDCQVHKPVPRNPQQKLTPSTSPWPFYKWEIDIAETFPEGPGKVKFLIVAINYFTKWIEAKPVATITGNQIKKFVWDNIVCRFGLPG